jgi:ferrous iron transport protein B
VKAAVSSLSAVCLLVFSLIYTPCVAAIASVRREMGAKWAAGLVVWQCVVAWVVTSVVHLIGMLI